MSLLRTLGNDRVTVNPLKSHGAKQPPWPATDWGRFFFNRSTTPRIGGFLQPHISSLLNFCHHIPSLIHVSWCFTHSTSSPRFSWVTLHHKKMVTQKHQFFTILFHFEDLRWSQRNPNHQLKTDGQHPILWVETTHPKLVVYRISLAHPQHVLRLFFPDPHQVFETWAYQPMIYHIPFILRHRRQSFLVKSLKSPTLNIFSIIFHHFSNIFVQFVPLLEPIFLDLL